tara:strand:- start:455564 stop:455752 length:189 start_codon:yes stop_codon:yes gene_type:complete
VQLQEEVIHCPYCGERLSVLLDPGDAGSSYTEDCQVCCRPIVFSLSEVYDAALQINVQQETE